ncbi:MAG: endonuclease [Muribaculaceae bacterium]|nr:endonuclease [Muribaculaceae bacterium]
MTSKSLLTIIMAIIAFTMNAEIPAGYYSGLNGKKEAALKYAAYTIISPHTLVSSYSDLPKYFQKTDARPDGLLWWEMYSGETFYLPSFSGMNREHSVPKSWWGGSSSTPAYTDLNHLYPSEKDANTAKSNYPLGTVSVTSFDNGVSKVGTPVSGQGGGAAKVFEPADEYKGDFARTYFYMATCYQDLIWKYTYMFQQGDYPTLNAWTQELLLKWHRQDPVSQKEIDRNEQVYLFQNNRNPFIDFPQLAEYIWGDKKGELFYTDIEDTPSGEPNLITPTQGMSLDFGQVAIGSSVTNRLYFNGENLTGTLSLTLSRNDKAMFSLSSESIATSLVNSEEGYWLEITYTPTATGAHTTKLIVSDGGITGSRGITLNGECLDAPSLSAITALPATDITTTGYTANWEIPASDDIDYYIVNRTRYIGGETSTEEIEAESNSLEITDFDGSDSESYTVQSVRLGHRSPLSNVIFVEHAGITGTSADNRPSIIPVQGGVMFSCNGTVQGATVYDISGKTVMSIPAVEDGMTVPLATGIYFITTTQLPRPERVIVK